MPSSRPDTLPEVERWNPKKDGLKYAKEAGACSDIDWLAVYADAEAVAKQVDSESGVVLIVGPNWDLFISRGVPHECPGGARWRDRRQAREPEPEPKPKKPGIGDKVRDDDYQFINRKITCGVKRVGDSYW